MAPMIAALTLFVATLAGPLDLGAPRDAALDRAAAALAAMSAARGDLAPIADPEALRLEVTRAGAQVAEPYALGVWARIPADGLRTLRERAVGAGHLRPTASGFGRATREDGSEVLVALLSRSPLELAAPLPSTVAPGSLLSLRGKLREGLRHPQVHVTPPGGRPVRLPITREGEGFACELHLASSGRTVVEVVGVGADGPEVALLAHIHVGEPVPVWAPADAAPGASARGTPEGVASDQDRIAERIATLRKQRGLQPLRVDPALGQVAHRYAEELAAGVHLSHRSADGSTVVERLAKQGIRRSGVGENLGEGPTVEAALAAIERSPAHLGLLLDPSFTDVGIGVARRANGAVVVVQVLAAP